MANANAGSKILIHPNPINPATATLSSLAALSYTEIKGIGSFGESGSSTNILTYDTWDTDVIQKAKGMTDAGSPELEVARISNDPGQMALRAACLTNLNYAIKIVKNDHPTTPTAIYNVGLVTGPKRPNGRNEDFDLELFTFGFNRREITSNDIAPPTPAPSFTQNPSATPTSATIGQPVTLTLGTVQNGTPVGNLMQGSTDRTNEIVNNAGVLIWTPTMAGNWSWLVGATGPGGTVSAPIVNGTASAASGATGLLSGNSMPSQPQSQPTNLVPQPAGEFGSATGWSTHTGLTIDTATGLAIFDGTQTSQQALSINLTSAAVVGREYGILSSVVARSAGQVSIGLGTPGAVTAGASINSTRTRTGRVTATGASTTGRLTVQAGAALSIDYLRIYDLTAMMQKKWRIIVLLTQSQGVGAEAGQPTDSRIYVPEPRALYVPCIANSPFGAELDGNGIGRPMPACDPMQHQTTNAGGGPGTTFCRVFCDGLRDDEVTMYVASGYAGGGMLANNAVWNRTQNGAAWAKMVATVDALRAAAPAGSSVAGMILWQGESDRVASSAIPHATELRNCVLDRRAAWGNFPVVAMPIGGDDWNTVGSNTYNMIQAHYLLDSNSGDALSLPLCSAVQRNPSWTLRPDNTHYDQDSSEAAITIAARRMLQLNYGLPVT